MTVTSIVLMMMSALGTEIVCPGEYGGHLQGLATDDAQKEHRIIQVNDPNVVAIFGKIGPAEQAPYDEFSHGERVAKDATPVQALNPLI